MAYSYADAVRQAEEGAVVTAEFLQDRWRSLFNAPSILKVDEVDHIRDVDWIRESSTSSIDFDTIDKRTRFLSSADIKFEDTSLGGSYTINPFPQFTRYADPRARGMLQDRRAVTVNSKGIDFGMGHYYSEAYDDTKQVIHMRMGVPEYNSMVSFFTGFFDQNTAQLARSGSVIYNFTNLIGRAAGTVLNIMFWPLLLIHAVGRGVRWFMNKPANKYYYLRPTMNNYWTAVTTMLNQIMVYKRVLPVNNDQVFAEGSVRTPVNVDQNHWAAISSIMPGIFSSSGFIDVYKIANRAEKIRVHVNETLERRMESSGSVNDFRTWIRENAGKPLMNAPSDSGSSLAESTERWLSNQYGAISREQYHKTVTSLRTPTFDTRPESGTFGSYRFNSDATSLDRVGEGGGGDAPTPMTGREENSGFFNRIVEAFKSEYNDGSAFATFRVDYTGQADESFSSSTTESDISSKFNQLSADGRAAQFSFANGNIDGGIITAATDAFKGFMGGVLSAIHMDGLLSLAGAAFVDIPEHWDNSSAKLPSMNYTTQLVSPYGHPISQMINVDLPLCMLLSAALPLSAGPQAYTSPFLIELFDPGKAQTRLGIIESLTIVRGTTNLGFNKKKQFLSADVSFTIKDLSKVMHMPITTGLFSVNPLNFLSNSNHNPMSVIFGDDTVYSDYLHVLAGASLHQSIYRSQKLKDNFRVWSRNMESLTSIDRWAGWVHDSPVGMLDVFMRGTGRGG